MWYGESDGGREGTRDDRRKGRGWAMGVLGRDHTVQERVLG